MTTHSGEIFHGYESCEETFECIETLELHPSTHEEDGYICILCKEVFSDGNCLLHHLKSQHDEMNRFSRGTCLLCCRNFKKKGYLENHLISHGDKKLLYKCPHCDKIIFKYKSALDKHILMHSDDRSFVCTVCKKSFKRKYNLSSHVINFHSDKKPFKCKICSKSFKTKGSLKKHFNGHSEKTKCSICHKAIEQKNATDTKEHPYACSRCEIHFIHSNSSASHTETTSRSSFKCSVSSESLLAKLHTDDAQFFSKIPFECGGSLSTTVSYRADEEDVSLTNSTLNGSNPPPLHSLECPFIYNIKTEDEELSVTPHHI